MGVYGFAIGDYVPVVFLGILAGVQPVRNEWVHRGFEEVWAYEYTRATESGQPADSGSFICFLSGKRDDVWDC